ncbi:hypothetical protein [Endothiovibrio diazotrophicus]
MHELILRFWSICLMKAGPQDLPSSRFLVLASLAAYLGSGTTLMLADTPPLSAFAQTAVDAAGLALVTTLLLNLRRHPLRLTQTYTALVGSGTLLNLAALPVTLGLLAAQTAGGGIGLFAMLWLALVIWSLMVTGHIFRHALEIPFPAGIIVAMAYMVLIIEVTRSLFPAEAVQ